MTKTEALDIIYRALQFSKSALIKNVTRDGDHKSAEIILTTEDDAGLKQVWLLPLDALREISE